MIDSNICETSIDNKQRVLIGQAYFLSVKTGEIEEENYD
jgi:hypothetical protein